MSQRKCCCSQQQLIEWLKVQHTLSQRKRGVGGRHIRACQRSVSGTVPRLLTSYVNVNLDSVFERIAATPCALLMDNWLTFHTKRQPTESSRCRPTSSLKQCIMSPVKPLQCRSVTTHLFSQDSLASLSDCSLSSRNPAMLHQQRCLTDAMDFNWLHTYWVVLLFVEPQGPRTRPDTNRWDILMQNPHAAASRELESGAKLVRTPQVLQEFFEFNLWKVYRSWALIIHIY